MEVHTSNTTPRPVGRPRISDEEWESHEGLISRLYRTENRTLRSVMHAVKEQNGFSAR
jgi:hypothetical protein